MLTADYVFWPALALMVACSLYYGPRIKSDRVAMQWGFDGRPTWHAPKQIALWLTIAIALVGRLLIWAAMTDMPSKVNGPDIGLLLLSVILAATHFWILRTAARTD